MCHGRQIFSWVRVAQSSFLCHGWQTFSGVCHGVGFVSIFSFLCHGRQIFFSRGLVGCVAQSLIFCVMVGILLVGFLWLNLQSSMSWQVDFQWGSCGSIFSFLCHGRQIFSWVSVAQSSFLCHGWQTFNGVRVAQSLGFCVMVGRLLAGFVWFNLQFSVSWLVDIQWGLCGSIFSFVSWLVDFQWGSCGSIFCFLCHGWQTFSGVRVAQSLVFCVMVGRFCLGFVWLNLVFCVMVGRLLVGFVWLNLQVSVSWQVDFQRGSCGSIFSFPCHGWQTISGVRVAQSLVLCHGWYIFSGVRVAQSLVFCLMVGRFLIGFMWLNLVFCVMVGRLLVGFVWLNLQFSVSWLVDFQWGSCGSIVSFLCHGRQIFSGVRVAQSSFLCHGWQTFSGVRVAQSLGFCVMVGRLLARLVWLNRQFSVSWQVDFVWGSCGSIQFSVSWLVDFQWGSCGSIFRFLCHGRQTFSEARVAQSLVFRVIVGRLLVGFVWLNLQFCVMVGIFLVGFVWLNLQFSGHGREIFSWVRVAQSNFLCHGWQTFSGVRVAQSSFLCHGWQTFRGFRVAQSLGFCVMVGRLLVGFVWLNLQFSVSWQAEFQWGSCGSIFSFVSWEVDVQWGSCGSIFNFLCHGWYTFSWFRVAQSLVFYVMVGRLLVGFVWLNLQFSLSWQVDFQLGQCGSIQFSVSWLVDFQWGSCGSIFSFLCHGQQTFSGVCVAQSLVLYHGWQIFSGVRVAQSLVFCVMVDRLLVGFVWLNLYLSVSWLVYFQLASCGSIFSLLCHGWQTFSGVRVAQSLVFCVMVGRFLVGLVWLNLVFCVMGGRILVGSCGSIFRFLCHDWWTFNVVRVAQSFVFCVMVGRPIVGFVCLNLQFPVSWLVDFQWASCGSIFRFLCHGRQTFSGVRVAQSLVFCVMVGRFLIGFMWLNLVFCVMVGRLLVGFVWLNLQFSVSWQVDFQWGSCGSIFSFLCHGRQIFSGVSVSQSSFLCHGWQTFRGVRVAQSLGFCVMVGRLLVGFVWLNLQFSVSWQAEFQWGSCGSIFSFVSWEVDVQWGSCGSIFNFLCHGWYTFSWFRVAQSLVFYVMVGRLLVGFVWLNLQFSVSWQVDFQLGQCGSIQFSVSWLVDFQWGSCGSIFRFLCHGRQTFSGVRVALSLVFCVMVSRHLVGFVWLNLQFCIMVGRFLVGFVWLNLQVSVSWQVDFQWGSCGSIFSFLCHGRQNFSGVRVAQSLVLCHGRQTFSGVRVAQSLIFCVMVGILLVGFVWLNLQSSMSWLVDFQWGSCGSIFSFLCHGRQIFSWVSVAQSSFLCHGWQTFSGVRVAQSLGFCVMVGRLLAGFVWLYLQFSVSWFVDIQWGLCGSIFSFVSWLVDFQWGSCGSISRFLCHGRQTFSGARVVQSLVFCVMVGRLLVGFVWLNLQFCVMVGIFLVGFVWLNLQFSVSWLIDFQWGSCGSIFTFLSHGWQTFSGFVWLNIQISVS